LHQSPRQYGIKQTRWRLQDVGRVLKWLEGCSEPGIYKLLKRLGFSRKKALYFIHSPDPAYQAKWHQILAAYQEAVTNPAEVILLFQDEFTYYRRADLRQSWQRQGRRQRRRYHRAEANTKARVTAVLNGLTGQVVFRQRHKIGAKELIDFYAQVRAVYPTVKRIYLVQDNWPVHKLPAVMQAASDNNLTLLFLPTYASWLNPIEKLWRWLRQDVLHDHDLSHNFKQLRREVITFLDQFAQGSLKLLNYVGLLSKEELSSMCQLIC
jgi:transposase